MLDLSMTVNMILDDFRDYEDDGNPRGRCQHTRANARQSIIGREAALAHHVERAVPELATP